MNRTLRSRLATVLDGNYRAWDEAIYKIVAQYNRTPHDETNKLPVSFYTARADAPFMHRDRFRRQAGDKFKPYKVGDLVLKKVPMQLQKLRGKLADKYDGPYKVIEVLSPVAYRVELVGGRKKLISHFAQLKFYHGRVWSKSIPKQKESKRETTDRRPNYSWIYQSRTYVPRTPVVVRNDNFVLGGGRRRLTSTPDGGVPALNLDRGSLSSVESLNNSSNVTGHDIVNELLPPDDSGEGFHSAERGGLLEDESGAQLDFRGFTGAERRQASAAHGKLKKTLDKVNRQLTCDNYVEISDTYNNLFGNSGNSESFRGFEQETCTVRAGAENLPVADPTCSNRNEESLSLMRQATGDSGGHLELSELPVNDNTSLGFGRNRSISDRNDNNRVEDVELAPLKYDEMHVSQDGSAVAGQSVGNLSNKLKNCCRISIIELGSF